MLVGIDLETSGLDPVKDDILIIALAYEDGRSETLDARNLSREKLVALFSRDVTWVAHNAKFDFKFIYAKTGIIPAKIYCTMLGSQILTNGKKLESECGWSKHTSNFETTAKGKVAPKRLLHGLLPVLERFLGIKDLSKDDKKSLQLSFVGHKGPFSQKQLDYAKSDVINILDLYKKQTELLYDYQLNVVADLEMKVLKSVIHIEHHGCLIDIEKWRKLIAEWTDDYYATERELDAILRDLAKDHPKIRGGQYTRIRNQYDVYQTGLFSEPEKIKRVNKANINYSSASQVQELFNRLNIKLLEVEGIPTVDESGLLHILNESPGHFIEPFIKKLLHYRGIDKLLSTYGESFLDRLDENGYIHTEYTQCMTDTGRFSSRNPNLQNLPNGSVIRECFIAKPGHKMVTYDMASAEVRIAADYSREQVIIDSILKGTDMHSYLASKSFSIIFEQPFEVSNSKDIVMVKGIPICPADLRKAHKPVTFAKFYKGGANRIRIVLAKYINQFSDNAQLTAKRISDTLDQALPNLTAYLSMCIDQANEPRKLCGYTEYYLRGSKTGRIRFFNKGAYGDAANFPRLLGC